MFVSPLFANWAVVGVISPTAGLVSAIMAMSVLSGVSVRSLLLKKRIGEEVMTGIIVVTGSVWITGEEITGEDGIIGIWGVDTSSF